MTEIDHLRGELAQLRRDFDTFRTAAPFENASIKDGRVVFIGGLLLLQAGATLTVIGHVSGEGDFVWSGPWAFTGAGEITGDVDITGDLELLDEGKLIAGNVRIEDGKIFVGGTAIVIDGATATVTVGSGGKIVLDGTVDAVLENGEYTLGNGAKLAVGLTGGSSSIGLIPAGGTVDISANAVTAWLRAIGSSVSVSTGVADIDAGIVRITQLPTKTGTGLLPGLLWRDPANGRLYRITS